MAQVIQSLSFIFFKFLIDLTGALRFNLFIHFLLKQMIRTTLQLVVTQSATPCACYTAYPQPLRVTDCLLAHTITFTHNLFLMGIFHNCLLLTSFLLNDLLLTVLYNSPLFLTELCYKGCFLQVQSTIFFSQNAGGIVLFKAATSKVIRPTHIYIISPSHKLFIIIAASQKTLNANWIVFISCLPSILFICS